MNQQASPKIRAAGLTKSFDDHEVLRGVDLEIDEGESLVLFGTSGSGKSVLLKSIYGLIPPDSGSIRVDGEEITDYGAAQRTRYMDRIGVLFQYSGLFDSLRVWENITFQLTNYRKMGRAAAKELAVEKLISVGLGADTADLFPNELSGGMQKRVGIARAIASDPEIVFLDEPTAGLDPIMTNRINELINQVVEGLNATAVTITSDMSSARQISDHMAMIHEGRIIWTGKTERLDDSGSAHVHQFVNQLPEGPIQMRVRAE